MVPIPAPAPVVPVPAPAPVVPAPAPAPPPPPQIHADPGPPVATGPEPVAFEATPADSVMSETVAAEPSDAEPPASTPTFPLEEGRLPHEEAVGSGPRVRMVLDDGTVAAPDDPELKERLAYLADNILKSDRSRP